MPKHIMSGIIYKNKKVDVIEDGYWTIPWPNHRSSLSLVFYIINRDGVWANKR